MADIDSLNIKIQTDSTSAAQGLQALAQSLTSLKTAVNGMKLNTLSSALSSIASAANTFNQGSGAAIQSMATSLTALSQATSGMKISPTLGANIASLNSSLAGLQQIDTATIEPVTTALQAMSTAVSAVTNMGNVGGLSDIAASLNSMASADTQGVAVNIGTLVSQLNQLNAVDTTGLTDVASAAQMINAADLGTVAQNVAALATAITQLSSSSQQATGSAAIADLINNVANAAANVSEDQIRKLEALANATLTLSNASGNVQMPNMSGAASDAMNSTVSGASGSARGFISILRGMGSAATSAFGKFPALVSAAGSAIDSLKSKMSLANTAVGGFLKSLARVAKMRILRGIIRGITTGISEGLKGIARSSAEANATLGQFSSGTAYLKNSLAAALYPAIAACVGAFNTLISVVVAALNAISMLFSVLGGKASFTKATRGANEFGTAAGGAAGGAAALKQELMGFDEINSLSPSSGGGGGGGGGGISAGVFEEALIPQEIADMINAGDFTKIGESVASKINEALASINWDTVKSKAKWCAKALTTLINGFIKEIDTVLLGTSLGEAFNTVLIFALDFWKNTDWTLLGQKLGEGLKALFDTINPVLLAAKMIAKFNAIRKLLIAFFNTNPFQRVAEFFNEVIGNLFTDLDLPSGAELAQEIAKIVNDAIDSLWIFVNPSTGNLKIMVVRIAGFIRGALRELPTTLGKLAAVTTAIVTKITEACKDVNLGKEAADALCDSIKNVLSALELNGAESAVANIAQTIAKFLETCINRAPDVLGSLANFAFKLAYAIAKSINTYLSSITMSDIVNGIKKFVENCLKDVKLDDIELVLRLATVTVATGALFKMFAAKGIVSALKSKLGFTGSTLSNLVITAYAGVKIVQSIATITDKTTNAADKAEEIWKLVTAALMGGSAGLITGSPTIGVLTFGLTMNLDITLGEVGEQAWGGVKRVIGWIFGDALEETEYAVDEMTPELTTALGGYAPFKSDGTPMTQEDYLAIQNAFARGEDLTASGIWQSSLYADTAEAAKEAAASVKQYADMVVISSQATQAAKMFSNAEDINGVYNALQTLTGLNLDSVKGLYSQIFGDASNWTENVPKIAQFIQDFDAALASGDLSTIISKYNLTEDAIKALQQAMSNGAPTMQDFATKTDTVTDSANAASTAIDAVTSYTIDDGEMSDFGDTISSVDTQAGDLKTAIVEIPAQKDIAITIKNAVNVLTTLNNIKNALNGISGKSISVSVKAGLSGSASSFLRALRNMSSGSLSSNITTLLNCSAFARGGFPQAGQLFIANESGPEMVGRIGSKTAVANETQIGDAIFKYMDEHDAQNGGGFNESSFANAMVRAMKAAGIGMVSLDGRMLANSINRETQRSGKPAIQF